MKLTQSLRMLNRHFGCELPAAFAGSYSLAARSAVDPTAAFQFEQISSVAENHLP